MKKMKKEYMILLGIIAVLLIYLLFGTGRTKMSYSVPNLNAFNQSDITRIEVTNAEGSLVLSGEGDVWTIHPQEFPADLVKIQDMLKTISELQLTDLAAESQDFQRYDLDEDSKITVKAFHGDELLRQFDIGKTPATYRHTFVRMTEDTRIYYAKGSFRSRFELEINDLRDKTVMGFDRNEISEIIISQAGEAMIFAKTMLPPPQEDTVAAEQDDATTAPPPGEQEAWVLPDGRMGEKTVLDGILSALSDLRCDEFLEDESPEQSLEPVFSVTVKGTKDYTLKIFTKQEGDNGKYPAISSENAYPFLLSTYGAEQIIKKDKDLFPETEKEAEIR